MDKLFSIFGKVVLVILILSGVAYGSYYVGQKGRGQTKEIVSQNSPNPTASKTPALSPTPTPIPLTTILGGVSKSAGLSYYQYSVTIPTTWTERKEKQTPDMDEKLILEKDGYQISIFQAATGGALCLYPGNPDFEGPSSRYTVFVDITTGDGLSLRRSGNDIVGKDGKTGYTICQKNTEGDFGQPTNYGHISFSLPKGYSQTTLLEMDLILSSLNKI